MITLDEVIAVGTTELDTTTTRLTLSKVNDTAPSAILLILSTPLYDGTPCTPLSVMYGGNDMESLGQWSLYYFAPRLYVLKAPPRGPQDLVIDFPEGVGYKNPSYVAISLSGANLGFIPTFKSRSPLETMTADNKMIDIKRPSRSAILANIRVETWTSGSIGETDCIFEGDGAELGRWNSYTQYACLQLPSDGTDQMSYYVDPAVGDSFVPVFDALMVEITENGRRLGIFERNIAVA